MTPISITTKTVNLYNRMFNSLFVSDRQPSYLFDSFTTNGILSELDRLQINVEGSVLILNDYDFTLTNKLIERGIEDITILFTIIQSTTKEDIQDWIELYHSNYEQLKITYLMKERNKWIINQDDINYLNNKEFDYVISQLRATGANSVITSIMANINFKNYISLTYLSPYRKGSFYNNIDLSKGISAMFSDKVTVPGFMCYLKKEKQNDLSYDEFSLNAYRSDLRKFYTQNYERQKTSNSPIGRYAEGTLKWESHNSEEEAKEIVRNEIKNNLDKYFLVAITQPSLGVKHNPSTYTYKWNYLRNVTVDDIGIGYDSSFKGWHDHTTAIKFDNPTQRKNFTDFWYNGKLMHKLLMGLNKGGGTSKVAFPDVDWNRPWTDEEILRDYGYSEQEIYTILNSDDSLSNRLCN